MTSCLYRGCFPLLMLLFVAIPFTQTPAQGLSDEQVLAELMRQAAKAAMEHLPQQDTELHVVPSDAHPMPFQIFSEEMALRNIAVRTRSPQSPSRLTLDLREMNSSTTAVDKSSYLRTVTLSLGVMVEDRVAGTIAWSKSFHLQRSDTLSGVPAEEYRDFREVDDPTWVDTVLIPVLTAAAAVLVVVLLFTVRGS